MKRIFGFGRKKKEQSPSGSASLPRVAGVYDLQQKDHGKLHHVAASGDLAQVRQGLKKLHRRMEQGRAAVQCQQEECVAILLEHGAEPNLADTYGNTALHFAVSSPNASVAGLLLKHNANIDSQNKQSYKQMLFLSYLQTDGIMASIKSRETNNRPLISGYERTLFMVSHQELEHAISKDKLRVSKP